MLSLVLIATTIFSINPREKMIGGLIIIRTLTSEALLNI